MTLRTQPPSRNAVAEPVGCEAAELFGLIWSSLVDLLGSAATATLLRRSLKRAAQLEPSLATLTITREQLVYTYTLPDAWRGGDAGRSLEALRVLARELRPLLEELTGPVVLHRLRGIPQVEACRVFPPEETREETP